VLLALLGLALCAAAFLATRGARDPGGAVTAAPAPAPAEPVAKPAERAVKPADPKPQDAAPSSKPRTEEGSQPAAPAKPQAQAPADAFGGAAKAALVKSALGRGDAVVFFFTHAGAADDTGTRQAVKALRGVDRVTIVRAGLNELTAFRPVLAGAGVSQVPAVVVAHADKPARLLEGYVDGRSLRQTVADALR
jgi:hypothetical protein